MKTSPLAEFLAACADVLLLDEMEITAKSVGVDGDTPLHVAIWQGKTEVISLLIEAGADIDAAGDMSETPLHVAVKKQNFPAISKLLHAGANPSLYSEFGQSPSGLAEQMGGELKKVFVEA